MISKILNVNFHRDGCHEKGKSHESRYLRVFIFQRDVGTNEESRRDVQYVLTINLATSFYIPTSFLAKKYIPGTPTLPGRC